LVENGATAMAIAVVVGLCRCAVLPLLPPLE
jgi:hypothetical protein